MRKAVVSLNPGILQWDRHITPTNAQAPFLIKESHARMRTSTHTVNTYRLNVWQHGNYVILLHTHRFLISDHAGGLSHFNSSVESRFVVRRTKAPLFLSSGKQLVPDTRWSPAQVSSFYKTLDESRWLCTPPTLLTTKRKWPIKPRGN